MTIRITLKKALLAVLTLGIAGMLFAWSGLFQIAASSGHWAITEWFLHWTMQNSVRTYSTFQSPEEVRDDTAMISAAGHYRQACQMCHGAPGVPYSPVMHQATPHAPNLQKAVPEYDDDELFWIVRHGVKYTGMPAWAADNRPDEVRRMVGFLRAMPNLNDEQYQRLTVVEPASDAPAPDVPAQVLATCTGCHGANGQGRGQSDIPILGGQHPAYLYRSLKRYAAGERQSALMQVAAGQLSDREMRALAKYFAAMPGLDSAQLPNTHPILKKGLPEKQLPACESCHAPGKDAPVIAGQKQDYIAQRLINWRGDEKVIDAHKSQRSMPAIARRIPEKEIDALAAALASE